MSYSDRWSTWVPMIEKSEFGIFSIGVFLKTCCMRPIEYRIHLSLMMTRIGHADSIHGISVLSTPPNTTLSKSAQASRAVTFLAMTWRSRIEIRH